jgi:predicted MPP superfamily phosphohydrolase
LAALTLNALLCLALLIQLYLFLRARRFIRRRRHLSPGQRRAAVMALAVFFGLMSLPYVIRLLSGRPSAISSPWFTYGVLYPFGVWSVGSMILFFFLGCASSLRWIASRVAGGFKFPSPSPARTGPAMSRRSFLLGAAGATAAAPLVLSAYGTVFARTDYETVEMDMPIRNLPPALVGLRLVQISDLHAGPFTTGRQIAGIVGRTNLLSPDLVMITGDVVHAARDEIAPCMRALSLLRARCGVFACQGNHEYWVGPEAVRRGAEGAGIRMLVNEGRVLSIDGARLNIAAVDDLGLGKPDLRRALARLDPAAPTLLLSHRPDLFPAAARRGVDLTLAGHYHGGQVKIRILGVPLSPFRLVTKYLEGPFRRGRSRMYVSRGLGTTGPPVRIGSRPELTLFRLIRG